MKFFNTRRVLFLLILFLVVFPKGGFKIGDLPITWGYLLLGITSLFLLLLRPIHIQPARLQALLFLAPFQVISACTIGVNGIEGTAPLLSFLVTFFVLPFIFFIILSSSIDDLNLAVFLSFIAHSIFWIAAYGIFLFFYRVFTGDFFEIPLLTINSADFGLLDSKCNLRCGISKLISTYNNGNIYGICLLMLLPMYCWIEKRFWKRSLVKFSLLLTLSRTIWIGLIISELFFAFFISKSITKKFMRFLIAPLLILCTVSFILTKLGLNWDFLFDRQLGGRLYQLSILFEFSLFSTTPFNGISEIAYMGILSSFGIFGLIAYLFAVLSPLFFSVGSSKSCQLSSCIRCGLCNYLILSLSDGAILLIPVMAFYWFLCSFLQSKNIHLGIPNVTLGHPFQLNGNHL